MAVTQVYVIYAEIPGVTDYMNVKIGISIDTEDRLRGLQTSNPFKLEIIKSFRFGIWLMTLAPQIKSVLYLNFFKLVAFL